jgi:hypothetical protein
MTIKQLKIKIVSAEELEIKGTPRVPEEAWSLIRQLVIVMLKEGDGRR